MNPLSFDIAFPTSYSIGHFSSVGPTFAPLITAAINFDEPGGVVFAIDNLSYDTPQPTSLTLW
jgi:hypothetical protein